jgi:nucleoid-associated protein YgaU
MTPLEKMVIKAFQEEAPESLADAPVWALQGVSKKDAQRLQKAFNIETIRDLADLKYLEWAREIVELSEGLHAEEIVPALANKLIKRYEKKTPKQLLRAPLKALQGVSAGDEKLLIDAFNVKTIKSFATMKYGIYAGDIVDIHTKSLEMLNASTDSVIAGDTSSVKKIAGILVVVAAALLILLAVWSRKEVTHSEADSTQPQEVTQEQPQNIAPVKEDRAEKTVKEKLVIEEKTAESVKTPELPGKTYTVKKGDSLVLISTKLYGDYKRWPEIYRLNKNKISRASHIYPGLVLVLPESN